MQYFLSIRNQEKALNPSCLRSTIHLDKNLNHMDYSSGTSCLISKKKLDMENMILEGKRILQ